MMKFTSENFIYFSSSVHYGLTHFVLSSAYPDSTENWYPNLVDRWLTAVFCTHTHTQIQKSNTRKNVVLMSHVCVMFMKYIFLISTLKSYNLPTSLFCDLSQCCFYCSSSKPIFSHEEFLVYCSKHQPVHNSYGETNSPVVTHKSGWH